MNLRVIAVSVLLVGIVGCGDPIGTACTIRGSGFSASQDCRHKCLQYAKIRCPDTSRIAPKVCSGKRGCVVGDCPSGQICYSEDDPIDKRSYCILADTCGPLNTVELTEWEEESFTFAVARRRAWAEKFKNHRRKPVPTDAP